IVIRIDLENIRYILRIAYRDNLFKCYLRKEGDGASEAEMFSYNYVGRGGRVVASEFEKFKFYRFVVKDKFSVKDSRFLLPPHGDNLLSILLTNKQLRKLVSGILSEYGFRLVLKPIEDKIEFEKEYEEIVISYPYSLLSDTLQRIIFHLVAIESNKDSIIAFEEPEAHAFPYYTKFLAERIALDQNNNQYFISTHNPYFLLSVIEKCPLDELAVFITYYQDYQTRIKQLTSEEIEKILDLGPDVFFNIESFIEGNK
ncbi:MAG: AAA family ATPase, partial [Staphylothermus sp.]|nr:AAA family ATPase [Staphylothermus sp.]